LKNQEFRNKMINAADADEIIALLKDK